MQQAAGKLLQRALFEYPRRGFDHPLQPFAEAFLVAPCFFNFHDVAVRAQCRVGGGEKLAPGEFGFFLVIVDVVIDDHPLFRCLAWLAGAQHNAGKLVAALLAQPFDHLQPGIVGFHYHVQISQRDVIVCAEYLACLGSAVGVQELHRAAVHLEAGQGQLGCGMHIGNIIDDQDFPARLNGRVFRGKYQVVVFFKHGVLLIGVIAMTAWRMSLNFHLYHASRAEAVRQQRYLFSAACAVRPIRLPGANGGILSR